MDLIFVAVALLITLLAHTTAFPANMTILKADPALCDLFYTYSLKDGRCNGDEKLPVPCDGWCNRYIQCTNGKPASTGTKCDLIPVPNHVFDHEKRECAWKEILVSRYCDWWKDIPAPLNQSTTAATTTATATTSENPVTSEDRFSQETTLTKTTDGTSTSSEQPTVPSEAIQVTSTTAAATTSDVPSTSGSTASPTTAWSQVSSELTTAAIPTTEDVRDSSDFQCGDGSSSVSVWSKCDGFKDCADGSDESDDVCDVPVASVSVGELVTVRVQHEEKQGHVDVSLCDNASCSTLAFYGSAPQGAPWFFSWTGCNARGANCTAGVEEFPIGRKYFPSGEVVLIVQRRSSELVVWLDGSPESVANVTIGADFRKLRVRPIY